MGFEPSALVPKLEWRDLAVEFSPSFVKGGMAIVPEGRLPLADAVIAQGRESQAGILILYGIDDLHYTAAALSFSLRKLGYPVVLAGSMRSGADAESDAPANLGDAISTAALTLGGDIRWAMRSNMTGEHGKEDRRRAAGNFHTVAAGRDRLPVHSGASVRNRSSF